MFNVMHHLKLTIFVSIYLEFFLACQSCHYSRQKIKNKSNFKYFFFKDFLRQTCPRASFLQTLHMSRKTNHAQPKEKKKQNHFQRFDIFYISSFFSLWRK